MHTLLVIDNDAEMQELLEEIFFGKGYKVFFYEETDNILALIKLHNPDLVLLDYNLNGLTGGELCKIIKANKDTAKLPVVLFSAYPKVIYSLKEYGSNAFIEKPFDIEEFFGIINTLSNINNE